MNNDEAIVCHVQTCHLQTTDAVWAYERKNQKQIDRHWDQARRRNPNYFDGGVWLISDYRLCSEPAALYATFLRTSFRACLYWRARGFEPAGVLDGFGSVLVRARDGEVLVACQRSGHVNAGVYYPPSGFIDDRDVSPDGTIDIEASVGRETQEELGLRVSDMARRDGFWVAQSGTQLAIAIEYGHCLEAAALAQVTRATIQAQAEPELSDIVMVGSDSALEDLATPAYVRPLVRAVLG